MSPTLVDLNPLAIKEARAARRWYARRSPAAAQRFVAELRRALDEIARVPDQWPSYLFGTQAFRLRRFPYLAVYHRHTSWVEVVSIAHTSRRPGYWRRRLPP